jgi:hypothetical protein
MEAESAGWFSQRTVQGASTRVTPTIRELTIWIKRTTTLVVSLAATEGLREASRLWGHREAMKA